MLPIHTILHPTDFSERSESAFHLATSIARDHGGKLIVVHVSRPLVSIYDQNVYPSPPENYLEKVWDQVRRLGALDPKVREELRLDVRAVEGDPATEILRVASETGSDLIVMGTHGRTGLQRLIMGSVAEQIVRKAACPVLTVKTPFPLADARQSLEKETSGQALEVADV